MKKRKIVHVSAQQQRWPQKWSKTILNFLGAWIAAINLFPVDLDQPWNYLWYCYEKAPSPRLPPFAWDRGQCAHSPASLLSSKSHEGQRRCSLLWFFPMSCAVLILVWMQSVLSCFEFHEVRNRYLAYLPHKY